MSPLVCGALSTSRPSAAERFLMWIPLLGWTLSHAMARERFKPMIREINNQLLARHDSSDFWTCRNESFEIAKTTCRIIAKELDWINDHFLPEDPMQILLWAHRDGLDGVFAIQEIEKALGICVPAEMAESFFIGGTLGGFVESLASLTNSET